MRKEFHRAYGGMGEVENGADQFRPLIFSFIDTPAGKAYPLDMALHCSTRSWWRKGS